MFIKGFMPGGATAALFSLMLAGEVVALQGDMNGDGVINAQDYAIFRVCLQGPENSVTQTDCAPGDFDRDSDVDLLDFANFDTVFGTFESVCGDGVVGPGEECDDGNLIDGDGCNALCQTEPVNDECANAIAVSDGMWSFDTTFATTDGPSEPMCLFFSNSQIGQDIWFCYTATCSATAVFSLCGSLYDTKLAVYAGCACPVPADEPLACNDDGCVPVEQSRLAIPVVSGAEYLVRVGGYATGRGHGTLTIQCGP